MNYNPPSFQLGLFGSFISGVLLIFVAGLVDLAAKIGDASAAKLIKEVGPKYADRKGGYTRITKLPIRASDAAKMAQIEFV